MKFRVAITGVGILCANGFSREEFWKNVIDGRSGIGVIEGLDTRELRSQIGGEIKGYRPEDHFRRRQLKRVDRSGQYAIIAAREAVAQSGLKQAEYDPYRMGVVLGTSLGGMPSGDVFHRQWLDRGLRRARASLLLSYPIHTACDVVAHSFGLKGPRSTISTACAAGANAIGWAADLLASGQADFMLAGGVDPLCLLSFAGFNSLQSLSPRACSPYSRSEGLNIGEGAAFLVLEPMDAAEARGARILAEFLGYGLSADAYHPTAPDPSGQGAMAAMRRALERGEVAPDVVSYINGHGTGTPANDHMEPKAMRMVFGDQLPRIPISSTKSIIGHTLGAAGAIEAATCVLAIERDMVPPTRNFTESPAADLDFVPNAARPHKVNVVVSNNYAFGGNNASLVLSKPSFRSAPRTDSCLTGVDEVVITGIGAVGAPGLGAAAWWDAFTHGRECIGPVTGFDTAAYQCRLGAEMPELNPRGIASPSAWRRMDNLARQSLIATKMAWDDAHLKLGRQEMERVAVIFATGTGPLETVESFNRGVIQKGPMVVNPILFPNTVMNATTGHLCMAMRFKGPTTTITHGGVSSVVALNYAAELIRRGEVSTALVVSSDEFSEVLLAGHDCIPGLLTSEKVRPFDRKGSGTAVGGAGISFVLESGGAARERGARQYARVLGSGMTGDAHKIGGIDPRGSEWAQAMRIAMQRSGVNAEDVGYCAAASCGVPVVDQAEARAVHAVASPSMAVGAPKSITGDCLGSGGAVNTLAAILALQHGILTPTLNLEQPAHDFALQHVTSAGQQKQTNYCLVNAVAFGGTYASLVLGKAD